MKLGLNLLILCFLSVVFSSQTIFAQPSDLGRISRDVSSRIDQTVTGSGPNTKGALHELLSGPLTESSAVRIALSNNPGLRATLGSWGIAKADFNEARFPANPVFGASVRFSEEDEPYNNTEFSVEQDFLSLIFFPMRSSLAGAELHKAELEIAKEVLDLAFEVKSAFYEVQGGMAMLSMRKRVLGQAEASRELAKRQFEAGNISELGYANERSLYQDTRLEYLKAEADFLQKKESLNRLMGFGGEDPAWEIKDELREIQVFEPSYDELLSMGMSKRLDLLIAKKNVEAQRHALSLNRFGFLGRPEAGVSTEKDTDGGRVTGPSVRMEVPIYDLGQTQASRSGAVLIEAESRLKALENDARSEIKQKRDHLFAMRALVEEYRNSVIPIREKVTEETQKHYNFMLLGNYDLIRAKQSEILAYEQYVDSLKNYWIARSDLEKAVGIKLSIVQNAPKDTKKEEPAEASHAHHGGSHA